MKIGIITMHKVLNYGSALQAYALQRKLFNLGFENEIIDYKYPQKSKGNTVKSFIKTSISFFRDAIIGFPRLRKIKKFSAFYDNNFVLTNKVYDKLNIRENPPIYDLYITGSDQVWNPRFAGNDVNFMLAFTPEDAGRISYASSFATNVIDKSKAELYSKYLSRYDLISVRERSGVHIVNKLIGKDATVCCDPTILLNQDEWNLLAEQSKLKIGFKYILVYILSYMWSPYPEVYKIVEDVQKTLGYKVIFLVGRKEDAFRKNSVLIKSTGPSEFTYLFRNAEFVITTSFHGAAFSVVYDKPLVGIVNKQSDSDSRIQSLLVTIGAEKSILDYRDNISSYNREDLLKLKANQTLLEDIRKQSESYLVESINKFQNLTK